MFSEDTFDDCLRCHQIQKVFHQLGASRAVVLCISGRTISCRDRGISCVCRFHTWWDFFCPLFHRSGCKESDSRGDVPPLPWACAPQTSHHISEGSLGKGESLSTLFPDSCLNVLSWRYSGYLTEVCPHRLMYSWGPVFTAPSCQRYQPSWF